MDSNLTANSELFSTLHDKERRQERSIEKVTLQEARRYGMEEPQRNGRIKYTYAGHVFIYDPKTKRSITSWKIDPNRKYPTTTTSTTGTTQNLFLGNQKKKKKQPKSGTRFERPIILQSSEKHDTDEMKNVHNRIAEQVRRDPALWTSHTVLVVDMSGSMREDDVNGARCRSDGVWTTLARNFVRAQLESKTCSLYDVVSVVTMNEKAKVVATCEPMDWVLYNKLVSFREWSKLKPNGHGFYRPALEKAEELLALNNVGSCSLSLLFFSDGKPSDYVGTIVDPNAKFDHFQFQMVRSDLVKRMGELASRFGRRLNITCIGIADHDEQFRTLQDMVKEARSFGANASFNRPSLNTDSLSQIISSSVASSLASKTEMTSLQTGKIRSVRTDVTRERQDAPDDTVVSKEWRVFPISDATRFVYRVWTWKSHNDDFARVMDPRCAVCYKPVANSEYDIEHDKGTRCESCKSCFFCARCVAVRSYRKHFERQNGFGKSECESLTEDRRLEYLVGRGHCPPSFGVAWKRKAFGEGAERLAFKFRYLNKKGQFFGPVMVAKESRFIEDFDEPDSKAKDYLLTHRHTYHKTFMRTQDTASQFAQKFCASLLRVLPSTENILNIPFIEFVKPLIFELEDTSVNGGTYNVLVEPLIHGDYKKFSGNNGDNDPAASASAKGDFLSQNAGVDAISAALLLGRTIETKKVEPRKAVGDLGLIEEGSEDEDDDSDEEGDSDDESYEDSDSDDFVPFRFRSASVPDVDYLHAFTHFSYVRSGGMLMVVDLQGALQIAPTTRRIADDVCVKAGQKIFTLTDPAIHHNKNKRNQRTGKKMYGRTDLGRQGMVAFRKSHVCNDVCRLLGLRELSTRETS